MSVIIKQNPPHSNGLPVFFTDFMKAFDSVISGKMLKTIRNLDSTEDYSNDTGGTHKRCVCQWQHCCVISSIIIHDGDIHQGRVELA